MVLLGPRCFGARSSNALGSRTFAAPPAARLPPQQPPVAAQCLTQCERPALDCISAGTPDGASRNKKRRLTTCTRLPLIFSK